MSSWTHVKGVVEVDVPGVTQAETRYVLDTVLAHLPKVTGSESDMSVYVVQESGCNCAMCTDEFGQFSNLLAGQSGGQGHSGWLEMQSCYMIVLDGDLRDKEFDETKRELMKFLCRLAKRLPVDSIIVKLHSYDKAMVISDAAPYFEMHEFSHGWTEYLRCERDPRSDWPLRLAAKYFDDGYIKEELERRRKWHEKYFR